LTRQPVSSKPFLKSRKLKDQVADLSFLLLVETLITILEDVGLCKVFSGLSQGGPEVSDKQFIRHQAVNGKGQALEA